jgi:hypothetical protein
MTTVAFIAPRHITTTIFQPEALGPPTACAAHTGGLFFSGFLLTAAFLFDIDVVYLIQDFI